MKKAGVSYTQGDLAFGAPLRKLAESRAAYASANGSARSIRAWLTAHRGWHAREEILTGARVDPDKWSSAINELVESGAVTKQGERRGTKYKAN